MPITSCVYIYMTIETLHSRTFPSLQLVNNEIFHVLTCRGKWRCESVCLRLVNLLNSASLDEIWTATRLTWYGERVSSSTEFIKESENSSNSCRSIDSTGKSNSTKMEWNFNTWTQKCDVSISFEIQRIICWNSQKNRCKINQTGDL